MRIIIIGTGLAGQLVLKQLRKAGYEEEILMITQHSGDFYTKPWLSKAWRAEKTPEDLIETTVEDAQSEFDCEILQTEVVRIDPESKLIHTADDEYGYDILVLAMGAEWVDLPILPEHPKVFRVNHLDDYKTFYETVKDAKSMTIIGGGLIGVEFAYDFAKHCQVNVVQKGPHLMSGMLPQEAAQFLKKGLELEGVSVDVDTDVQSIEPLENNLLEISTSKGKIQSEVVLAAIGLQSKIGLAEEAGLTVSDAIEVNEYGQTSDPSIYALGDCAKVLGILKRFVPPIRICAEVIGNHILEKEGKIQYPPMPVTVKTPTIPVTFCYKTYPENWKITADEKGVEGYAYEGENLVGFVLTGDRVSKRDELKAKLASWL